MFKTSEIVGIGTGEPSLPPPQKKMEPKINMQLQNQLYEDKKYMKLHICYFSLSKLGSFILCLAFIWYLYFI